MLQHKRFLQQAGWQICSLLQDKNTKTSASLKHKWLNVFCHSAKWNANYAEWTSWSTYREADTEMWRSTAMVLPPGVTAKRRLRAFKVDVLIHTRWIIIRHPTTTRGESNHQLISCCGSVITRLIIITVCVLLTQKKSVRMSCWIWISSWSSGDTWCWNIPSPASYSSAKWQHDMRPVQFRGPDPIK